MILQVDYQDSQSDRSREQGRYTDFTLICEGMKFEVHKIILCSQSPVFDAACTESFMASDGAEMLSESNH